MDDASALEQVEDPGVGIVRRTIVTALPLKRDARERLARLLDARVLDVRDQCDEPDLVLAPACSPQLIGALGRKYNGAPVVVVELDDWELDIAIGGPVKRLVRAGAAAYLLADSVDELARKIGGTVPTPDAGPERHAELAPGVTVDELVAALLRESVDHARRAGEAAMEHRRP